MPRSWVKYYSFSYQLGWRLHAIKLTTSVTVTSGRASIGAVKKPDMMLRAIHWPLVWMYGLV